MPQRFVLHLGVHKTATTALQDFLAGQAKALLASDVRYIPLGQMRSDVTPLLSSLDTGKRAQLANLLVSISQATVLLSDENIIGSPADLMNGSLYPFARNRIETFCAERRDAKIILFLTVRAPEAFLASLYCEYLRHNPFVTFLQYVADANIEEFSYCDIFGWLLDLPPAVEVRMIPFEAARGGGVLTIARSVVEAACGQFHDVNLGAFPKTKSRSAFSVEELELAGEIALQGDPKTAQHFLNMIDFRGRRFGACRFSPLAPELSAHLEARYDADLAVFAERALSTA